MRPHARECPAGQGHPPDTLSPASVAGAVRYRAATAVERPEYPLVPTALMAATWNLYEVPAVRPVTAFWIAVPGLVPVTVV